MGDRASASARRVSPPWRPINAIRPSRNAECAEERRATARAVTSEDLEWLSREITHTAKDNIDGVDFGMLAETALMLRDFVLRTGA